MRLSLALAALTLLATTAPSSAWFDRYEDCDDVATAVGAGQVADILARVPAADLDGDGKPEAACDIGWNTIADLGARAHEACHVAQQSAGHPALRVACSGSGGWHDAAEARRKAAAAECWTQVKALGPLSEMPDSAPVWACFVIGDLDGDGALDLAMAACTGIGEPGAQGACMGQVAAMKAAHEMAKAIIQNIRA